jgi:hypothetical protein
MGCAEIVILGFNILKELLQKEMVGSSDIY